LQWLQNRTKSVRIKSILCIAIAEVPHRKLDGQGLKSS
jgi:hypothetical protein